MSHVTGVVALIAAMVRAAGTLIVMPTFKAGDFHRAGRARAHDAHAPGAGHVQSAACSSRASRRPTSSAWRLGGFGGAPMADGHHRAAGATKLPRLQLMNAYGATETTSPATLMPPAETAARLDSVGLAVPCGEILVMDDDGREVPRGAEGEVWLRGPMVVSGYWNDPKAHGPELRRRLLALGRHRLDRCRGLRARVRPQEGHDQPRRLQDLLASRSRTC